MEELNNNTELVVMNDAAEPAAVMQPKEGKKIGVGAAIGIAGGTGIIAGALGFLFGHKRGYKKAAKDMQAKYEEYMHVVSEEPDEDPDEE